MDLRLHCRAKIGMAHIVWSTILLDIDLSGQFVGHSLVQYGFERFGMWQWVRQLIFNVHLQWGQLVSDAALQGRM